MRAHALAVMAAALLAACSGGGAGEPAAPPDTTAPVTSADPPGGLFGAAVRVTLVADEPATVHYTLDGAAPVPGAPSTRSGQSPLQTEPLPEGETTLRFRAVDAAGNEEAPRAASYRVDVTPPSVAAEAAPPRLGWLDAATVRFAVSEAATWDAELGGDGTPGSGLALASGVLGAPATVEVPIRGRELSPGAPAKVWLHATDAVGHAASAWATVERKALATFERGEGLGGWGLVVHPARARLYGSGPGGVRVVDVDPASATYLKLLKSIPAGSAPAWLALHGERLYVIEQQQGTLRAIDTAADEVVLGPVATAAGVPSGIAVSADGTRLYHAAAGWLLVASAETLGPLGGVPIPLLWFGEPVTSPDGERLLLAWCGGIALGVDLYDVRFGMPQAIASPLAPIATACNPAAGVSAGVGFAPVLNGDASGAVLGRLDLATGEVLGRGPFLLGALAVHPDGDHLFVCGGLEVVTLLDARTLEVLATEPLPSPAGRCAVSTDGALLFTAGGDVVPLR